MLGRVCGIVFAVILLGRALVGVYAIIEAIVNWATWAAAWTLLKAVGIAVVFLGGSVVIAAMCITDYRD